MIANSLVIPERENLCGEKSVCREDKDNEMLYQTLVLKVVVWIHLVVYYDLNGQEAREP